MHTFGIWLTEVVRIVIIGVVVYSLLLALDYKVIANIAKLLVILLIVQVTFTAFAPPIMNLQKKISKFEQPGSLLNKIIWFGALPEGAQPPTVQAQPASPEKMPVKSH